MIGISPNSPKSPNDNDVDTDDKHHPFQTTTTTNQYKIPPQQRVPPQPSPRKISLNSLSSSEGKSTSSSPHAAPRPTNETLVTMEDNGNPIMLTDGGGSRAMTFDAVSGGKMLSAPLTEVAHRSVLESSTAGTKKTNEAVVPIAVAEKDQSPTILIGCNDDYDEPHAERIKGLTTNTVNKSTININTAPTDQEFHNHHPESYIGPSTDEEQMSSPRDDTITPRITNVIPPVNRMSSSRIRMSRTNERNKL